LDDREKIPPDLALETLFTKKDVLFPDDRRSQSLLRALVEKHKLDPDISRIFLSASYRARTGGSMRYQYWGFRLLDLQDELENPTPRGFIEKWLERKSGARYVMLATLAGVTIAVVLGMAALAVSIFQAWVGWQQWQHPLGGS
jgi:hypothetical protein